MKDLEEDLEKKMKCNKSSCKKKAICSGFCELHFKDYFEKKVKKTIRQFELLERKQKIGVAVSGGKDSTVALYVLKKIGYDVIGVTVDAVIGNYTKKNLENLREVCKKHDIKLKEINFRKEFGASLCYIRDVLKSKGYKYSSCFICGILRRFLLNKYAKELKLDVLVTGHNLDDEAQSFIMNVFRNDTKLALRQGPITGLGETKKFVKRVKPLYMCTEQETTAYSKLMKFPVNYKDCPCSTDAYRRKYKEMLNEFEKSIPGVKYNIIQFFQQMIMPQKKGKKTGAKACKTCGEPAANETCRTCEIFKALKAAKK